MVTGVERANSIIGMSPRAMASSSPRLKAAIESLPFLKGTKLRYDIKNGTSKLIGGVSATGQGSGRVRGLFVPEDKKQ